MKECTEKKGESFDSCIVRPLQSGQAPSVCDLQAGVVLEHAGDQRPGGDQRGCRITAGLRHMM